MINNKCWIRINKVKFNLKNKMALKLRASKGDKKFSDGR